MTYTPGPWLQQAAFVYALNEQGTNRFSLQVSGGYLRDEKPRLGRSSTVPSLRTPDSEIAANARLIASAPDLLEALKAFVDAKNEEELDAAFEPARAAIAKAQEKQT